MKINFLAPAGLLFLLCIAACNNGTSTTTTDSTTLTTGSAQTGTESVSASKNITVHLDPSASYVDLKTGKPVKLRVDTVTKYIVDEVTNQPVMYYINPATKDTFDQNGRLVSRALIRSSNGDYSVDESRLTGSLDDNSNASTTDTSHATSADETTVSGNSKTKIKDDKLKQKTDTTTIKIKDNKVKIKTKQKD